MGRRGVLICWSELHYSLSLLPSRRTEADPNVVVYAVSSMNPLECEVVVVSSLHRFHEERQGLAATFRVLPIAEALGVMESDVDHSPFGPLAEGWGDGLATWKAVENGSGGPVSPEPDQFPESLRNEVAAGSWRLRPSQDGCSQGVCA